MISLAKEGKKKQKYGCNENFHTNQVTVQLNSLNEYHPSYHPSFTLSTQRQGIPVQYASHSSTKLHARETQGMNPFQPMAVGYKQVNTAVYTSGNLWEGPVG